MCIRDRIGVLPKQKYEDWRFGRVDYLERVCTVNLRKLSFIKMCIRDRLNLPTPEVEYHNIVAQPTEHQQEMVKALSERASEVHRGLSLIHI